MKETKQFRKMAKKAEAQAKRGDERGSSQRL